MSHMVIYRGSDGKPGYHQTDDIHDAVGFVEQMRNERGVEHARIFRLEEVVFQYRPYYHVELADSLGGPVDVGLDDATKPLVSLGEITGGYGNGSSSARNSNGGSKGAATTNGSNGHSEFATVDSISTVSTKSPLSKESNGSITNGSSGKGSVDTGSVDGALGDKTSADSESDGDADRNVALTDANDDGETSSAGSKRSLFGR